MCQLPRDRRHARRRERRAGPHAPRGPQPVGRRRDPEYTAGPRPLAAKPAAGQAGMPDAQFQPQQRPSKPIGRLSGGPAMTTGSLAEPRVAIREPSGESTLLGWFSSVDHKRIGILYICTALVFLVIGGAEALAIRLQLAVPNNTLIGPS